MDIIPYSTIKNLISDAEFIKAHKQKALTDLISSFNTAAQDAVNDGSYKVTLNMPEPYGGERFNWIQQRKLYQIVFTEFYQMLISMNDKYPVILYTNDSTKIEVGLEPDISFRDTEQ